MSSAIEDIFFNEFVNRIKLNKKIKISVIGNSKKGMSYASINFLERVGEQK